MPSSVFHYRCIVYMHVFIDMCVSSLLVDINHFFVGRGGSVVRTSDSVERIRVVIHLLLFLSLHVASIHS